MKFRRDIVIENYYFSDKISNIPALDQTIFTPVTPQSDSGLVLNIRTKKISGVINDLKMNIYAGLVNRFEHVNHKPSLLAATLLDPRYKELPFEKYNDAISIKTASHYVVREVLKLAYPDDEDGDELEIERPPVVLGKRVSNLQNFLN